MAIQKHHATNFSALQHAFKAGAVCLMECTDAVTGKPVITICAAGFDGKDYSMTPLAKMFDGNPYKELIPPLMEAA